MADSYIKIGADGINAEQIVEQIRQRAAEHRQNRDYDFEVIARAERFNLSNVKDNSEFLDHYLGCLGLLTQVDINAYEIVEHRQRFAFFFKKLKKGIWSLLKFYTYHLWSQQNQVNCLLHSSIQLVEKSEGDLIKRMQARIDKLEERLAELENKTK